MVNWGKRLGWLTVMLLQVSLLSGKNLVMALIPTESNIELLARFEPLRAYLEQQTDRKVKIFVATDYTGVIEAMRKKRVDIAWFGPMSYYLAEREAGAEAFAAGIRQGYGTHTYTSIFVVPANSPAQTLQDLKGKNVAFVDPASTSGGLWPTFTIKQETGSMPRDFFGKLIYAGSHDAAQLAVKNQTVDAAAGSGVVYQRMLDQGLIDAQSNRILYRSPPLPGSPLTYRRDLPPDLKAKIRTAILTADQAIENVGGEFGTSHYVAVSPADYQIIRDLVAELGL